MLLAVSVWVYCHGFWLRLFDPLILFGVPRADSFDRILFRREIGFPQGVDLVLHLLPHVKYSAVQSHLEFTFDIFDIVLLIKQPIFQINVVHLADGVGVVELDILAR